MGTIERANKRLQAWVEAQRRGHRDQRLDQGQQPHQQSGQDLQHDENYHRPQNPQRPPYPVLLPEEQQRTFRRSMYQALNMAQPQVHEQHARQHANPLFDQRFGFIQQPQLGQPQAPQLYHDQQNQLHRRQHEQFSHQRLQQSPQQLLRRPQHQPQQLPRQQSRQQSRQLQAQAQPRQDQPQNKHDEEKCPAPFATTKARYYFIKRVAHSSEGTVSLTSSISKSNSTPTKELRIVKSVSSNGMDLREAHILHTAGSHPNVLKMFESVFNETVGLAHMCMEYCSGGDLHDLQCSYSNNDVEVPDYVILKAVVDISDGLAFLHGGWVRDEKTGLYGKKANMPQIIHRDLKTSNIFVRPNGVGELPTFVLGDFGQSFLASEAAFRFGGGTPGFRAPEFNKRPEVTITDKADVYSFAMTILCVCQTLVPVLDKFKCGSNAVGLRLPRYLQVYTLGELLRDCLVIEPKNRPEMSPSGLLVFTNGYRPMLKSMEGYTDSLPGLRAADSES